MNDKSINRVEKSRKYEMKVSRESWDKKNPERNLESYLKLMSPVS